MIIFATSAGALLAQAAPAAAVHERLAAGNDALASATDMANTTLATDDPARLINLGVAHARRGDHDAARALFAAAADRGDDLYLETAEGRWVEARRLARRALAMLERGEFSQAARIATR